MKRNKAKKYNTITLNKKNKELKQRIVNMEEYNTHWKMKWQRRETKMPLFGKELPVKCVRIKSKKENGS